MRIKELIASLQKIEHEFPDHEIHVRNNRIVDRVEISNEGPELVLDGQGPVPRCAGGKPVFNPYSR